MGIFSKISSLFSGRKLDSATLDAMEGALIAADIAPGLAADIIAKLRGKFRPDAETTETEIKTALADILRPYAEKLKPLTSYLLPLTSQSPKRPLVFLVIGVNGAGKTTTIGKLAKQFIDSGKRVVIGACDTFRAAANEQLAEWATRAGAKLICGDKDPAAAAYKTIELAQNENADIVILDTAGRLHNRTDLMDELSKIIRVVKKLDESAPHETLLVLDGTTGQNGAAQIEYFDRAAKLSGLVVTKMDSTSKGGFLVTYAAAGARPLPVFAVGMGEKIGDMRPFDADDYLKKLLDL
ncbi:MAG: signal recognition particle-docking protein FtsY [Alphaproteobacteria bacterium]|nr:signal recognition particle-docking protein FtsY [Alphaproteobacteria bacterium]